MAWADTRAQALAGIVEALVKTDRYAEAQAAARQIESADARAKTPAGIAGALVKAGKCDEAKQAATEAVAAVGQLKLDLQSRISAHVWVMEMLAEVGRTDEALAMARQTTSADERARSLIWVMRVLVKAGKHTEASRVANEALATARQIENPDARIEALIDSAEALADSGRNAEAGLISSEALTALGDHGSYWRMDTIFRLLVKAGKNEEARQVAVKELAARQQLPPGKARTDALARLVFVTAISSSGTSAESKQVTQTVLEAAQQRKFEHEANRASFLVAIVAAPAQAGKYDEAVEAAGGNANQIIRIQALVRVSEELAKARQPERAGQVINEAQRQAQQLAIVKDKSFALAEVAKGLARLHYFRLAREAVESQASSQDKLAAYIVIVREYASERNPTLAQAFVGETPA